MIRLLIGIIVIGFLLYFVRSILADYFRPKPQPPIWRELPPRVPAEQDAEQVKKLQDRIAVLERLILDAENDKNSGHNRGDDGAGDRKDPPQI
jgi:hypothetical protein